MARTGTYCRAYHARDFTAFPGWRPDVAQLRPAPAGTAPRAELDGAELLYLQDDFVVTDGIYQDEHVVFADAGPEWRRFCADALGFAPPPAPQDEASAEPA